MNTKVILLLSAVGLLAACGGSSDGSAVNPTQNAPFGEIYLSGATIINQFNENLTTPSAMPVGSASYEGAVLINAGALSLPAFGSPFYNSSFESAKNSADIVGKLNLNANFDNNSLTGSITNVSSNLGQNASGSVSIAGGVISGNSVTASLGGSLAVPGASGSVTGSMNARFHGNNGEAIIGTLSGSAGGDSFSGIIAAKQ